MIPLDLLIALIVIAALSLALFFVGLRIGAGRSRYVQALFSAGAAAVLVLYAVWLYDSPLLARVLPVTNVLLWGNLQLPAAGLLGGVAWPALKSPRWQRVILLVALFGIGLWRQAAPLLGTPPAIGPSRWTHGVCRQTSTSSCSAASAATLLAAHNIPATESEMIADCLTRASGTTNLGIYRGLRIKTAATGWTVVAGSPSAARIVAWPLPALVNISLRGATGEWLGGVRHSVVIFGILPDGQFDVGDPFAGRQSWSREQLEAMYAGTAISLVH